MALETQYSGADKNQFEQSATSNPLAEIRIISPISVIIPVYKEAENIPMVIERLNTLKTGQNLDLELIFMDDQSHDGSVEAVEASNADWANIIVRDAPRGLSISVIDGFQAAKNPVLICMDGDLSHPPEKIPDLILALESGQDFAIGSRYVRGGSTDDDWGILRWLNSRVATWLARPLTNAKDPMSGFFAIRKSDFDRAQELNPVGYKIALELIVKCGFDNVGEIPIHFTDRMLGKSKLTLKEQLKYIQHIRRLYLHRFANAMYLLQFLVVGASGVVVNLSILTILSTLGASASLALLGGIMVSMLSNFLLNRRFTFSYARSGNVWKQLGGFLGASVIGMLVNYTVSIQVARAGWFEGQFSLQLAALVGISCGLVFNFLGNRFVVFRRHYIKKG